MTNSESSQQASHFNQTVWWQFNLDRQTADKICTHISVNSPSVRWLPSFNAFPGHWLMQSDGNNAFPGFGIWSISNFVIHQYFSSSFRMCRSRTRCCFMPISFVQFRVTFSFANSMHSRSMGLATTFVLELPFEIKQRRPIQLQYKYHESGIFGPVLGVAMIGFIFDDLYSSSRNVDNERGQRASCEFFNWSSQDLYIHGSS